MGNCRQALTQELGEAPVEIGFPRPRFADADVVLIKRDGALAGNVRFSGVGSVPGAALGGLLVGIAQSFGVWKLPTQWQDVIVFVILILFLLFRPQGFLGKPLRSATI